MYENDNNFDAKLRQTDVRLFVWLQILTFRDKSQAQTPKNFFQKIDKSRQVV